tara:strand:- start:310 stop:951 length:642 start_codon:yes stop_codon:yes gene_type:complete
MEFLDEKLEAYVEKYTSPESKLLQDLNRETWAKVLIPRMLSGHLQGRVLSMLSHMIRPKRVLEIGTYTGYSALCFAEGLVEGGLIHTIDINEELEPMIQKFIGSSPYANNIQLHIGNALDIIPSLKEDWDIVFIDADKENYSNYYHLLIDQLKPNSYVIADNVLWSGKVIDPTDKQDEETTALVAYSKMVSEDARVENVLFPIRDGLQIARVL